MDLVCFALPIRPGKTELARVFLAEMDGAQEDAYAGSARRLGIVRESWWLQQVVAGDLLLACVEAPNLSSSLRRFRRSQHPFDLWLKRQVLEVTSIDLNSVSTENLSEQLASYHVQRRYVAV